MFRPSNQKNLTIKSVYLSLLVVFSLIALTSCNLFSSRLTQDQQQPSKTSSSGQTQDQMCSSKYFDNPNGTCGSSKANSPKSNMKLQLIL